MFLLAGDMVKRRSSPYARPRMQPIGDEHLEHWRRHGYAVVERFLDAETLARALDELRTVLPPVEKVDEDPASFAPRVNAPFPFVGTALNDITVDRAILDFCARALGTTDVYCTQSQVAARYGSPPRPENEWMDDQPMHVDFGNNTLLVPSNAKPFGQLAMILYYTDVTPENGPTTVVSRELTRDDPLWPTSRSRDDEPEYYANEVAVLVPAGSLLIYEMRTFHRGSKFHGAAGFRLNHHLAYRAGGLEWMGYDRARAYDGWNEQLAALLERATPQQRQALGWPPPGDAFWTEDTLERLALRYPRADLGPYRAALA